MLERFYKMWKKRRKKKIRVVFVSLAGRKFSLGRMKKRYNIIINAKQREFVMWPNKFEIWWIASNIQIKKMPENFIPVNYNNKKLEKHAEDNFDREYLQNPRRKQRQCSWPKKRISNSHVNSCIPIQRYLLPTQHWLVRPEIQVDSLFASQMFSPNHPMIKTSEIQAGTI